MTTSVAETTMTSSTNQRPTLSQQLLTLSFDESIPAELRVKIRHASHRAKRQADELETARIQLHNLDWEACSRCGEWYGIEALDEDHTCKECLAGLWEEAQDAKAEQRDFERRMGDR